MRRSWWLVSTLGLLAWAMAPARADDSKKGTVVTLGALKSTAPADWKAESIPEQSQKFRKYQFRIPKVQGDAHDAELIVYFFGQGGGGSVEDNIRRWKGMFLPPEGKTIDDVAKVTKMKVGDVDVTYFDVQGTYKHKDRPFDPNAKEERRPDYRMVSVIFASKDGPFFLRFIGPAKMIGQHKKGFDEWLQAFR